MAANPLDPADRFGFRHAAKMECIKLASLRATWITLALTVAGAVAIGVAIGISSKDPHADVTNNVLAGIASGLLVTGVLGVLTVSGEYTSGTITTTFAAIPKRPKLLAAKAAVFGSAALVAGEVAAFLAFFVGTEALPGSISAPGLSDPGVLRAVILSGTAYCLIGLLGLGFGAIIRHTGAAVAALVGGVYLGAQLLGALAHAAIPYVPIAIVGDSMARALPAGPETLEFAEPLSPWAGFGVLILYATAALGAGGWLMARRDA
jgi:ABC-2 type transport system permease protein